MSNKESFKPAFDLTQITTIRSLKKKANKKKEAKKN